MQSGRGSVAVGGLFQEVVDRAFRHNVKC
jgi:hypothetical protein